jgi:hypothetical protein
MLLRRGCEVKRRMTRPRPAISTAGGRCLRKRNRDGLGWKGRAGNNNGNDQRALRTSVKSQLGQMGGCRFISALNHRRDSFEVAMSFVIRVSSMKRRVVGCTKNRLEDRSKQRGWLRS